jgi:hypothetical protein
VGPPEWSKTSGGPCRSALTGDFGGQSVTALRPFDDSAGARQGNETRLLSLMLALRVNSGTGIGAGPVFGSLGY